MNRYQAILASSVILALSGCDAFLQQIGERNYTEYPNSSAAVADRAVEKGWIPTWLPNDAKNIHLYYDLDTSTRAISFSLPDTESFEWFPECVAVDLTTKPRLRTRLFPRSPHEMEGVRDCVELYAVRDANGVIHMWTKSGNY